jgi:hypothetical protein
MPIVRTCLDGSHVCSRGWDLRDAVDLALNFLKRPIAYRTR